jgi:hypothetical protein
VAQVPVRCLVRPPVGVHPLEVEVCSRGAQHPLSGPLGHKTLR